MGILSNLFGKKKNDDEQVRVGGMEDFMTLIRVYYQAVIAMNLGITNLAFLPDLRIFKQTLHVPTVNNKLGIGEKNKCKKMLMDMYDMSDTFFKEIDASIKKNCRNQNDIKNYLIMFQGFSQDLMMLIGNLMQWKFRMPSMFHKALRNMTAKTINQILTRNDWKDDAVRRTCVNIRKYAATLGYSEAWMTEYVFRIVMLAKKEPKTASND
ncbi:hypothetical protein [Bacteroides sp. OF04-15BH]|jgi:hypothetical protein|uniref:hypothetical protein n=1 Tax=Bacteroides sp. OF04-15BH TaxID=2292281 RepID=UPI000E4A0905|nr:hypothetical protein [Bacteroides sp. OF04-15BH]RHP66669.1 hypothetical protein DXA74_02230 [Bacteroides sp. OF04-15BH]